jgi:hypothetical protein
MVEMIILREEIKDLELNLNGVKILVPKELRDQNTGLFLNDIIEPLAAIKFKTAYNKGQLRLRGVKFGPEAA